MRKLRAENFTLDELWSQYEANLRVRRQKSMHPEVWTEDDLADHDRTTQGLRRQIEDVARGIHLVKKLVNDE